jgi:hypothetical protein
MVRRKSRHKVGSRRQFFVFAVPGGKRSQYDMRAPDDILKTVGFVAEHAQYEIGKDSYDPEATGFFVEMPSKVISAAGTPYFVTAKHVIEEFTKRRLALVVNKKGGGITRLEIGKWYTHSDKSVDVAVTPFTYTDELDFFFTSLDIFLDPASMKEKQVGIGDEVYMPGLFALYNPGKEPTRNVPLMRYGNIAMLPDEPIQTSLGFAEVFLIEARSIGGMSGSPVFARRTSNMQWTTNGVTRFLHGVSNEFYLLGLMHGHWDIAERDINNPKPTLSPSGVNIGLGIVVPAHKILEVLNDPELVAERDKHDAKLRASIARS